MFSIGDLVKLKSGGPAMTVWGVRADSITETCWFRGEELMRDAFHPDELLDVGALHKAEAEMQEQKVALDRQLRESA